MLVGGGTNPVLGRGGGRAGGRGCFPFASCPCRTDHALSPRLEKHVFQVE